VVELFEYAEAGRWDNPPRAGDAGGFHLGLQVPDIHAALAELDGEPRVTPMGTVQTIAAPHPLAGRRWIYLRTQWGLLIELVTPIEPLGSF
jgi:hypothetical protein